MELVEARGSRSSSDGGAWEFSYDVFLNFRGEDTRYGFTGNLYAALNQRGIRTFLDDEGLRKGEEISLALVNAIEGSRVSILVFSKNYAASSWCLDELLKILECQMLRGQLVIPVFYQIEPSVVRNQTGPYEKAMANLKKTWRDNKEKVNRWRSALYQAANLSGWHLEFGYEYQFIQNIVEDISSRLKDPIFLELQTTQAVLGRLKLKADGGSQGVSETASSSKGGKENAESYGGGIAKKLLFFSNWRSEAATGAAASSTASNGEEEGSSGGGQKKEAVGKSSRPSKASAPSTSSSTGTHGGARKLIFFGKSSGQFDLEDLLTASAEVLGKGTFGTSYKAVLENGTVTVVKRLKDVTLAEKDFKEKMEAFGAMDHENLLPLRGYYFSEDEKLIFHDYMPMGSLSDLLHGRRGSGRTPLNWVARLAIALGAARGIEYIHSRGPNFCHGNIKSSNILLTKSSYALVSDFGLASIAVPSSRRLSGNHAPELSDPRTVSQKSDVFSFGVLLLELLTGKAPSSRHEEGVDLPRWVRAVAREEWTCEVFDVELLRYPDVEEEMIRLLKLGLDCTGTPGDRPVMSQVTKQIEELSPPSIL